MPCVRGSLGRLGNPGDRFLIGMGLNPARGIGLAVKQNVRVGMVQLDGVDIGAAQIRLVAVSYTHLDGYKRQLHLHSLKADEVDLSYKLLFK